MSITSKLATGVSSLLIASVLIVSDGQLALACSASGTGASVSHGSAMHSGSVTVCVGVQTSIPAAPAPNSSTSKPATGISIKPVAKPVCPSVAQRRQMPRGADAAERWLKTVCGSTSKPVAAKPPAPPLPAPPVAITPVSTSYSSASVSFSPNPLSAAVFPGPSFVAGESVSFSSNPSLHYGSQLILGRQAEVQFSPAWLGWQFSDGTRIQGVDVKRSFESSGRYQAWAIANYFVSYRILGETAWQAVPGQIAVLSNVLDLEASVKIPPAPLKPPKLLLVGGECSANPQSWGCLP